MMVSYKLLIILYAACYVAYCRHLIIIIFIYVKAIGVGLW